MGNIAAVEKYAIVILSIIFISLASNWSFANRLERHFLALLGSVIGMLVFYEVYIDMKPGAVLLSHISLMFSYISFYLVFFWYNAYIYRLIQDHVNISRAFMGAAVFLCVSGAAAWSVSVFREGMFVYEGEYQQIPEADYWFGQLNGLLLILMDAAVLLWAARYIGWNYTIPLISHELIPLISYLPGKWFYYCNTRYICISVSVCIIFAYVHVSQMWVMQDKRYELVRTKTLLLSDQIRPHFIFNVLNSIYYMCDEDPAQAKLAITYFSDYLRKNMEHVNENDMIRFEQELSTVQNYLNLEKLRYEEELSVEYDLKAVHFMIPALTIEPIVENAVKHGIGKKRGGGTVRIETERVGENIHIRIKDDGVGFTIEKEKTEEESHVGINNVRERIRMMCGGTLTLSSKEGKGTVAEIILPQNIQEG